MKKSFIFILFSLFFVFQSSTSYAVIAVKDAPQRQFLQENFGVSNVEAFVNMTPKEIAAARGKQLKLRDKIVLKLAQKKIKKHLKKGTSVDVEEIYETADKSFNIGGFLLGFFLSIIGVLIALLFGKNAFRSSLIGLLCGAIVALIVLIL